MRIGKEDGEMLAQHVESRDRIEAEEIRNKVGWSRFTGEQKNIYCVGIDLICNPPDGQCMRYYDCYVTGV